MYFVQLFFKDITIYILISYTYITIYIFKEIPSFKVLKTVSKPHDQPDL